MINDKLGCKLNTSDNILNNNTTEYTYSDKFVDSSKAKKQQML